jgi:hypothetical protein
VRLQFPGGHGFLDFLRVRHLLRGVADEQGHPTDEDGYAGQAQQAVG